LTPAETIDAICGYLVKNLENLRPGEKKITVYPYALPDPEPAGMIRNASLEPDDYEGMMPAVIVSPVSFEDKAFQDGTSLLTVSILAGAFSHDHRDGPRAVVNMLERARRLFLTERVIENSCEIQEPLNWQMYDDSTRPLWMGEMTTQWRIAVPHRIDAEDWKGDLIYF
jgi:hypothetical protein